MFAKLSVEMLEGRSLPSTLGLTGGVGYGGATGGVLGDRSGGVLTSGVLASSANATVIHLGGGGHLDLTPFLSRSSGEEIPQTLT
jgi:hypothetical protein